MIDIWVVSSLFYDFYYNNSCVHLFKYLPVFTHYIFLQVYFLDPRVCNFARYWKIPSVDPIQFNSHQRFTQVSVHSFLNQLCYLTLCICPPDSWEKFLILLICISFFLHEVKQLSAWLGAIWFFFFCELYVHVANIFLWTIFLSFQELFIC